MPNKNRFLIIGSVVLFLCTIFMVAFKLYRDSETSRLGFIAEKDFKTFVPEYSVKIGTSTPKIYLVEFLDPECESCRYFYPQVKKILEDYSQDVQLVIRYAPFHTNSTFAIKILEAARKQNRYLETLETLFEHQPEWGSHHHPNPNLIWSYLPGLGLDVEKIKADMNDPEIERMIQQEIRDLEKLSVRGTPTFFVNGKPLESFGVEQLRTKINAELKALE